MWISTQLCSLSAVEYECEKGSKRQVCRHTCLLLPFSHSYSTALRLHNCVEIHTKIDKLRAPYLRKARYVLIFFFKKFTNNSKSSIDVNIPLKKPSRFQIQRTNISNRGKFTYLVCNRNLRFEEQNIGRKHPSKWSYVPVVLWFVSGFSHALKVLVL